MRTGGARGAEAGWPHAAMADVSAPIVRKGASRIMARTRRFGETASFRGIEKTPGGCDRKESPAAANAVYGWRSPAWDVLSGDRCADDAREILQQGGDVLEVVRLGVAPPAAGGVLALLVRDREADEGFIRDAQPVGLFDRADPVARDEGLHFSDAVVGETCAVAPRVGPGRELGRDGAVAFDGDGVAAVEAVDVREPERRERESAAGAPVGGSEEGPTRAARRSSTVGLGAGGTSGGSADDGSGGAPS